MRQCFALNMSGNLLVLSVPKAQTTSSRCKNVDIPGISIDCILTAGSGITSYDGKGKSLSCIQLFVTPWTIHSVEFFRPEYWSGQPFPSLGNLPNPQEGLPHCRWILYQLIYKGSPRILEWVAIPFPANLPDPGIKARSPAWQPDSTYFCLFPQNIIFIFKLNNLKYLL